MIYKKTGKKGLIQAASLGSDKIAHFPPYDALSLESNIFFQDVGCLYCCM